jgi:dTDP-4-dehydrorhamnose reductase
MSKLAGEETVRALNTRHFVVRTAWLYHTVGKNFPKTICSLADKPEIRVVNDQFGSPTYAPHLAQALSRLMETDAYGTYHIAGFGGTNWFEFTRTLFNLSGITTKVTPVSTAEFPRPAPRPAHAVLTTLQDPPMVLPPWEQGLQEFVRERSKFNG